MTKTIIAIDIDDVLADTTEALRVLVNERTGSSLTRQDYLQKGEYWQYYERVWQQHGIVDKISYTDLRAEMAIDQSHVSLVGGAALAIRELSQNYHIILITSRDIELKQATKKWLKQQFDHDDIEIHYTGHRRSDDYISKGKLCRELGVSWMIDDNVQHCQSVIDEGIGAVLFGEYGWHENVPAGLPHCRDWPEVIEYFKKQRKGNYSQ